MVDSGRVEVEIDLVSADFPPRLRINRFFELGIGVF